MSQFNYTKKPGWYPSNDVAADPKGWVYTPTGEVLVAMRGLVEKNTDAATPPSWTLTLPTDGTYGTDDLIVLTLVPDEAVFVVGTPFIPVTIGADVKNFMFDAETSTPTELNFSYVVLDGDVDADGIVVADTLNKNGGKLYDVVGDGQVEITGNVTYVVGNTSGIIVAGV